MATYYSSWQNNIRVYVVVSHTQNITNNTSTIRSRLYVETRNYWWFSDANMQMSNRISGVTIHSFNGVSRTYGSSSSSTTTTLLADSSRTITHNANGAIGGQAIYGALVAGITNHFAQGASGTYSLPTIPRATTPNTGGASFTTGSAQTINLPRASSSFTHDVTYKIGTKSGTIATGAGASTSWTPPHSLATEFKSATSSTVAITVVTKSGSTTVGTKKINVTLRAASSIVPTVSKVTWTDSNSTVKTQVGAFVQGLSRISGAVTASGTQGSTISLRQVVVAGTTHAENKAVVINKSGTTTASGRATDSRGRVGTLSANIVVLAYSQPTVAAFEVFRANSSGVAQNDGKYLRLRLKASVASLMNGSERNAMNIQVRTRPSGGSWTNRNSINPGLTYDTSVTVTGEDIYLTTTSYDVQVVITDSVGQVHVAETTVATGTVTLDLSGTKVGVGKYHERGGLDVAGDVYSDTSFKAGPGTNPTTYGAQVIQSPGTLDFIASGNVGITGGIVTLNGQRILIEPSAGSTDETSFRLHRLYDNLNRHLHIYSPANANIAEGAIIVGDSGTNKSRFAFDAAGQAKVQTYAGSPTASATRPIPFATAAGIVTTGTSGNVTVTLPAGRFTVAPRITCQGRSGQGTLVGSVWVADPSATSFGVSYFAFSGSRSKTYVEWHAIQMTPSAASG